MKKLLHFTTLIFLSVQIQAQVTLPKIFGDNMLLQRNKPLPVWGFASPGEKITVKFGNQTKTTITDTSKRWQVVLDPLIASDKPSEMEISGKNTIKLTNILVGEVWLCSGQSNMEYPLKLYSKYAKPAKGEDLTEKELKIRNPNIRIFKVEKKLSIPDVTTTGWNQCGDSSLAVFSAAGYFFGKDIYKELNVPVGLIMSAWGGTRIEPWTSPESYSNYKEFQDSVKKTPPTLDGIAVGKLYNSMIKPLVPFALRGFLWYQGESNCMLNETLRYTDKMKVLIENWRTSWNDNTLPFYYVQIAPYYYTKRKDKLPHTDETLPLFWEAQAKALAIPNTGMIVTTDLVDSLKDIHPSYKWEVGRRLSLLSLKKDYNKSTVICNGPSFQKMNIKKNTIILNFKDVGDGLKTSDGKSLTWFNISGPDNKYYPASATIKGKDQVIVSAKEVSQPQDVRFAWSETAMPNLVNSAGLPAVPFRTNSPEWKVK